MGFNYVVRPTAALAANSKVDLLKDKSWRQAAFDRVISAMILISDSGSNSAADQTAQLKVGEDIVAEWDYVDDFAGLSRDTVYKQVSIKVPANSQLSLFFSNLTVNPRTPTFGVTFTT